MPTRPDRSRGGPIRARRTGRGVLALVSATGILLGSASACSAGRSGGVGRAGPASGRRASSTTTTTVPVSAAAYFAALAEGGPAGALKMAATSAPGSPARQYAEHLARLAALGVTAPAPWAPVPSPDDRSGSTPPTSPATTAAGPTTPPTTATTPTTPTTPPGPPTSAAAPADPAAPASSALPGAAPTPTTAPPPPPTPTVEPDRDGFRICSGAQCERYDGLTFADGLVSDFRRGGRPLTSMFARPGAPVARDGVTVQFMGASRDAAGTLVAIARATNGSGTRWNLGYVQRYSGPGDAAHDTAGVILGPSALDPGGVADLGLPFPGASVGGTVHLTTFLGAVSDPAAKVVYFDLPAR